MALLLLPLLAAAAIPAGTGLDAFDRLSGRCWEGRMSAAALDVHCFEPVYDGAHVRDRHRVLVDGQAVYEGETIYSRDGDKVVFVYVNSQGGVGHGEATPDEQGICFTGSMRGSPDAAPQAIASCWRWQAEGGYLVTSGNGEPVRFVASGKRF